MLSQIIYPRSLLVPRLQSSGDAAGRSHPAPQGKALNRGTGCYTKSKTLNKRLHGPKILLSSLLDTALSEK